jgi:predicted MFS family arabinose efflux permease
MPPERSEPRWRHGLLLLSAAAGLRAFCIGLTGVLLGLHLARLGYSAGRVGLVIGAGLAGNALATAILAAFPGRIERRTALIVTTVLSAFGLIGVAAGSEPLWLAGIAFVGLLNGMGRDRGPAQVVEQSLLADRMTEAEGPRVMARYTATQDVLGGLGSLAAGLPDLIPGDPIHITRLLLAAAGILTLTGVAIYLWLLPGASTAVGSDRILPRPDPATRRRVRAITGLFALDSLGGGFLAGSILSYWFFKRFGLSGSAIGPIFLAARALNVASYFGADLLARRIGLIRTMVFTHLPSSVFLLLLPWATTPALAILLFLAREALVQMDVPARQAFIAAVTRPGERVYAFGVTGLVRNVGWAVGPGLAGGSVELFGLGAPLVLGAGLKMVYDVMLYRSWGRLPSTHEAAGAR